VSNGWRGIITYAGTGNPPQRAGPPDKLPPSAAAQERGALQYSLAVSGIRWSSRAKENNFNVNIVLTAPVIYSTHKKELMLIIDMLIDINPFYSKVKITARLRQESLIFDLKFGLACA
jgi:hypothetical protein